MLSAQDEAFVRLAIDRGALAGGALGALASAPASHKSAIQVAVDEGWLSSLEATALLRELMALSFACGACGVRSNYEGLASLSRFACRCGGSLVPAAQSSQVQTRVSSGSFPLPGPDASRGPADSDFVRQAFGSTRSRVDPQPGQVLGPYRLERELGRGANGVVFLARRPGLERDYALKVLLEDTVPDAETVARFELEAAIGSKLRDPGVVPVYDVGRAGDCLYYAMEYSPGPTLKEVLRERGRLPWQEACDLCQQLALTLAHCHERSVIHRDLKPGNIILDSELDRPRVTDFGLARDRTLAQAMTATGDWLGTPYYMSPEQFLGETDLDHRADLYALGTILFEVLTGERPYVAKSAQELMDLVLEGRAPSVRSLVPELPSGLDHIVQRALESDPDDRYPDAREFAADLAAVQAGQRLAPERRRLAAGVSVALATIFALAAFGYHERSGKESASAAPAASSPTPSASQAPSKAPSLEPKQAFDWGPLLADWRTWSGDLDLDALRKVRPPLPPERLAALEATREAGQVASAVRGAPWSELKSALARVDPKIGWVAFESQLELFRARLLLARGRSRAALGVLAKRRSRPALWLRALAHEALHEEPQAKDLLARLVAGNGAESALAKARQARADGEFARALALIDSGREVPEAKLELAETLVEAGDSSRASAPLSAYLERWGPSPRALRLQGDLCLGRGEVQAAVKAYETGARLLERERDPDLTERHGRALLRAGRAAAAVDVLSVLVPPTTNEAPLTKKEVGLIVLRGLARWRTGAEGAGRADWGRVGATERALAEELFPESASESEKAAFTQALAEEATPPPPEVGVETADFNLFRDMVKGALADARLWYDLTPLGELPAAAIKRFATPPKASETERDVAAAIRTAAEGKSWKDVRFYLARALDTGTLQDLVRSTWMRLARGRGQDLETLAKRLAGDVSAYGLSPAEGAFARAELSWLRGDAGQALLAFREQRGAGKSREELLAGAHAALLEGDFQRARREGLALGETWQDGRGFAIAGLAALALNQRKEAAKNQRVAYAILGASDYRVLALRAALAAGGTSTSSGMMMGELLGPERKWVRAIAQLTVGGRPAEFLALRVLAETDHEGLRSFFASRLARRKGLAAAELKQALGYSWVRLGKERKRCLSAWSEARRLDARLPLPAHYLKAYVEAYETKAGLDPLR